MIRFLDHYVTNGAVKARVSYSAGKNYVGTTGNECRECVTLYAKSFDDGDRLGLLFPEQYQNDTDSQTDYFERGRVKFFTDHPLYWTALAASKRVSQKWSERQGRLSERREARRAGRVAMVAPVASKCGPDCHAMMSHTAECVAQEVRP